MAQRRMFSKQIVQTDAFLDMPQTSQLLYFHLAMEGDDDGFVSSPKKIMKIVGASDDNYRILIAKRFIIPFESGVCVIKHWRIHNLLRGDRYTETTYLLEKSLIGTNEYGAYTEIENSKAQIKTIEKPKWKEDRKKARQESNLPYSFDYKIRKAFWGKNCPICNVEMREYKEDEIAYGMQKDCKPTIQHNIPISKGGKHELGNISVICHSCNVSTKENITGELNSKEVIEIWQPIGNQSATQDRIGKDSIGKSNIDEKVYYGESKKVRLSGDELQKLYRDIGETMTHRLIDELDDYIASTGKRYHSHYATIRNWARRKAQDIIRDNKPKRKIV